MEEPVTTESGITYEKEIIKEHFEKNGKIDPVTRKPVRDLLYPNVAIKQAVDKFLQDNPWAFEYKLNEDYTMINF